FVKVLSNLVDVEIAIGAGCEFPGVDCTDGRCAAADVAARAFEADVRILQDDLSDARSGYRTVGLDADRLAVDVVQVDILFPADEGIGVHDRSDVARSPEVDVIALYDGDGVRTARIDRHVIVLGRRKGPLLRRRQGAHATT